MPFSSHSSRDVCTAKDSSDTASRAAPNPPRMVISPARMKMVVEANKALLLISAARILTSPVRNSRSSMRAIQRTRYRCRASTRLGASRFGRSAKAVYPTQHTKSQTRTM